MSTENQVFANQQNAQKSTGPTSDQGKATCSMNGLRDGLYAATLVLPRENQVDFDRLREALLAQHDPQNSHEMELVDELAAIKWKQWRVELIEQGTLIEYGDRPASELIGPYDRITRVQGRLRRDYFRIYKDLERLRDARAAPGPKPVEASARKSPAPKPTAPKPEGEWATADEMLRQDPKKEFKLPKYYEVLWTPVQGQPPKPFARLYKGQSVKEWPADDPPPAECVYMDPGQPPRLGPYPPAPKPPDPDDAPKLPVLSPERVR
ncbi:MAG: hypothetical protein ABSH50_00545 [Bryobacteraceae bacterium]|jgi:hypothetical protein